MLSVEGLRTGYGRNGVLHGVDLTVGPGEVVSLLGANGAGKTTLLRVLSGVHPALGGRIALDGQDITRAAPHRRLRAGMAHSPEGRRIFKTLTVAENLRLGAYLHRDAQVIRDTEHALDLFPVLGEKLEHQAAGLSGGQQQMLAIARALMSRPRYLLLDEPSLGLAPRLVDQVMEVVARLRGEGVAILLVEQNAMAALGVADRAYVMETGRITLSGPAAQIRTDPAVREAYLGIA